MLLIGAATLPNDTPMTFLELALSIINARTFDADAGENTARKNAALSRARPLFAGEVFIEPSDNIYMVDAYKGVTNGVVVGADWADADFTAGGAVLAAGVSRRIGNGANLNERVVYQNSGADVTVYLEIVKN